MDEAGVDVILCDFLAEVERLRLIREGKEVVQQRLGTHFNEVVFVEVLGQALVPASGDRSILAPPFLALILFIEEVPAALIALLFFVGGRNKVGEEMEHGPLPAELALQALHDHGSSREDDLEPECCGVLIADEVLHCANKLGDRALGDLAQHGEFIQPVEDDEQLRFPALRVQRGGSTRK